MSAKVVGRRVGVAATTLLCVGLPAAQAQIVSPADAPWATDAAVQAVFAQRERGIEAMTSGRISADSERYSSTFVANTPNGTVVPGEQMLRLFASGNFGHAMVERRIDYAAAHGEAVVVIMGEETVVPLAGAANAGRRVVRRFTDVFRLENGEWRHDVRHANVVAIED